MAPKAKPIASSSSVTAVETQIGGASLQEAPISLKTLQIAFAIIMNTKRLRPLNLFLKFWTVDVDLAGPRLICGHDSHVDEQNADLVILVFLFFVNATLASANWTRVQ